MGYYIDHYLRNSAHSLSTIHKQIEDAREMAEEGAEFLDEHFGDESWREDISVERLAMGSCFECVLGQLFGSYAEGASAIGPHPEASFDYQKVDMHTLTMAWIELLTGERFQKQQI
jgi:hypothetical protein